MFITSHETDILFVDLFYYQLMLQNLLFGIVKSTDLISIIFIVKIQK